MTFTLAATPSSLLRTTCLVTLLCSCFIASFTQGQPSTSNLLQNWVDTTKKLKSTHITWLVGNEAHDPAGNLVEFFEIREICEFSWPTEVLIESRAEPQKNPLDATRSMMFDKIYQIDSTGHHVERKLKTTRTQSLGDDLSLRKVVGQHAYRAPYLLGVWLAEHPDLIKTANTLADGSISIYLSPLNLKAYLETYTSPAGTEHQVVSKLELLAPDQSLLLWWEYDDFHKIGATNVYTGHMRIPFSGLKTGIYEGPPAIIEKIGISPKKPVHKPIVTESKLDTPPPADDHHASNPRTQSNRLRHLLNRAPSVLIFGGVFILIALGVTFALRAKSSP